MGALPAAQFAPIGSNRIAYYEAGIRTDRPFLILRRGFPETAYSWRHRIQADFDRERKAEVARHQEVRDRRQQDEARIMME
mgnify:FL=1